MAVPAVRAAMAEGQVPVAACARVQPVAVGPAEVAAREPVPPREVMAVPRRGVGMMPTVGLRAVEVTRLGAAAAGCQSQGGGEGRRAGQEASPRGCGRRGHDGSPLRGCRGEGGGAWALLSPGPEARRSVSITARTSAGVRRSRRRTRPTIGSASASSTPGSTPGCPQSRLTTPAPGRRRARAGAKAPAPPAPRRRARGSSAAPGWRSSPPARRWRWCGRDRAGGKGSPRTG
jgi:hypothetical protein